MKPLISVVIGTLNRPMIVLKLVKQLIDEYKKNNLEIIIFDQSSVKNKKELSIRLPKKKYIRLIKKSRPNTVAYLNDGYRHSKSDYVLYLDDDVKITSETIPTHIRSYADPAVMGVAGRVINKEDRRPKKSKETGIIKWCGAEIISNFSSSNQKFVLFPYGCNMSFRKSVLKEIDGFDNKLKGPIYAYNEIDLGIRLNKKYPRSLIFKPKAVVRHLRYKVGGTRDYNWKRVKKSVDFNYGYFIGKNFSIPENIICFLRRLPYQLIKDRTGILPILEGYMTAKSG